MIIHGKELNVYVNGSAIANAKTGTITLDADLIETASSTAGDMKTYIVSRLSWKMSAGTLVGSITDLSELAGTTATLSFGVHDNEVLRASGNAICSTLRIDAVSGSLATASVEFQGTGTISRQLYDLFWGTVLSEYVRTSNGEKIRIINER